MKILGRFTWNQVAVFFIALLPFANLAYDAYSGGLTFNPIQEATFRTGKLALIFLLLSLACTPLNTIFGWRGSIRYRRMLGLFAFFYASIHFLIFVALDYGLSWPLIKEAILEKRYAVVGFSAFLILLPLALTSTKGWQKRLKKGWKRLHQLVYLAGILVIIHFVWLVKSDVREPLLWGTALAVLLALRIPPVRRAASRLRYKFHLRSPLRRERESGLAPE
ncbi:MAG TPA: protein-methionine-sulfoxide reductase heme-binding subunit MsrQ [Anaerolineales bacterium]|nr:protein-methionine-sulfoxide reductase heme-binding subunit MsrQ [Anaerolineales bacterium]